MNRSIYIMIDNKIALLLMFFLLLGGNVIAQMLRPNLVVNARPSAYLAEWYRPQNGMLVITSANGTSLDKVNIRIETELMNSDEQVIYSLSSTQSEVLQLSGNAANFTLDNILQLQKGNFSSAQMINSFSNGGKLEAGQYSIRIRIWDALEGIARSEWTVSKPLHIMNYQLPQLMQPADGKELEMRQANSYVTFRWTPLAPTMAQNVVSYRFQIWQVQPNQTPMQSLRSTPPIEDRIIKGTTQFIWQTRLNMIVPETAGTNQFIWTVQSLDEMGMPVATTDPLVEGRSEPFTFSLIDKAAIDSAAKK